jgi:hypothetical protein
MMADTFRADDEAVANNLDLTPDDGVVVGRKASEVLELAVLGNFGERSTVGLTNGNLSGISMDSQFIHDRVLDSNDYLRSHGPYATNPTSHFPHQWHHLAPRVS